MSIPRQKEEIRVEEFTKQLGYSDAFEYLTEFYGKRAGSSSSNPGLLAPSFILC